MTAVFSHPEKPTTHEACIEFHSERGQMRVIIREANLEGALRFDIPKNRLVELMMVLIDEAMGERFCVDGTMDDGLTLQGDGMNPPFKIFDILKQRHIHTQYETRAHAYAVCQVLNGE